LYSCQRIYIIKKEDIHEKYKTTVFENASMKKAIEDVASNFGRREASVVIADDVIIVRADNFRINKVKTFISLMLIFV
jgi:hypothetical protein